MPFVWLDIVEELTKTLKKIKKPYEEFEAKYKIDLTKQYNELEPSEAQRFDEELAKTQP
jgi:hypothetical protein